MIIYEKPNLVEYWPGEEKNAEKFKKLGYTLKEGGILNAAGWRT